MPDREIWNHLLNKNARLTQALTAIRDGHEAGREFLADQNIVPPEIPTSLGESINLAEQVADVALTTTVAADDLDKNMLRALLLRYGTHQPDCIVIDMPFTEECQCAWTYIRETLGGDPS